MGKFRKAILGCFDPKHEQETPELTLSHQDLLPDLFWSCLYSHCFRSCDVYMYTLVDFVFSYKDSINSNQLTNECGSIIVFSTLLSMHVVLPLKG